MIARWLLASGVILGTFARANCDDTTATLDAVDSSVATRDVIYFHPSYPVFLRLHIQVDNASFDATWLNYVKSIFEQIDTDDDRRLTLDETQGKAEGLSSEGASIVRMRNLWMADENPFDRAIRLPELTKFLIDNGRGPFQPQTEQLGPPVNDNVGDTLFDLLDSDQNRLLTSEELANAMQTMRRRDLDDDGTFGASELKPSGAFRARLSRETPPAAFVALVPGSSSPSGVLNQLVKRYGKNTSSGPAGTDLSAKDLGLDEDVFAKFDVDSSNALDNDELRRLIKNPPPTLELLIRLGDKDKSLRVVEMIHSSKKSVAVRTTDQLVSIVLDNVQIEIGQETSGVDSVRRYLVQQFKNADQDNNKYLEEKEIQKNGVFNASFNEFDIDGDGKMFEDELNAAIDSKAEVAKTRTRLSLQNRGRDLFQILDSDRDLRLSAREFAAASRRIELWDNDADGAVGSNEVPQMYQLSLGPGQPVFRGLQLPGQATQGEAAPSSPQGPVWFQKMDRNNDGELSRREFPGTRAQFQALDSDNNGLVDPDEAREAVQRAAK